jgi:uncharacterized membrane protein
MNNENPIDKNVNRLIQVFATSRTVFFLLRVLGFLALLGGVVLAGLLLGMEKRPRTSEELYAMIGLVAFLMIAGAVVMSLSNKRLKKLQRQEDGIETKF